MTRKKIEDGRYEDVETRCEAVTIKNGEVWSYELIAHDSRGSEYWEDQQTFDEDALLKRLRKGEFKEAD